MTINLIRGVAKILDPVLQGLAALIVAFGENNNFGGLPVKWQGGTGPFKPKVFLGNDNFKVF